MNKIKFYFSKKNIKKLFSVFLRYKYLLVLIFFSAYLAFVFNVTHKYAYVDINFMEYEESYEGKVISNIKKGNRIFKEILANVEERDRRFEMKKNMEYNNPFEFRKLNVLEDEKAGDLDSEVENDLIPPLSVEAEK
ncbi:MAG: hypothetical protein KAU07_02375 [Candidatus Andersenbacteria bacterium]|nr:hypothetical protein [Candidatus Andersenbacteria bacterium]